MRFRLSIRFVCLHDMIFIFYFFSMSYYYHLNGYFCAQFHIDLMTKSHQNKMISARNREIIENTFGHNCHSSNDNWAINIYSFRMVFFIRAEVRCRLVIHHLCRSWSVPGNCQTYSLVLSFKCHEYHAEFYVFFR